MFVGQWGLYGYCGHDRRAIDVISALYRKSDADAPDGRQVDWRATANVVAGKDLLGARRRDVLYRRRRDAVDYPLQAPASRSVMGGVNVLDGRHARPLPIPLPGSIFI